MNMAAVRALCFLVVPLVLLCQGQNIQLENNGYKGILIAISEDVLYDPQLLERIKTVFNDASAVLYSASRSRAYFRDITILIPSTWPPNVPLATTETFEKANIRVDNPSARYGDNPWVKQTAGCGVPGEYMHLTPEFLLNEAKSVKVWGATGKVIVHEWGHLRWGLFDEYPIGDEMLEHFYYSPTTNSLEASRCNSEVRGRNRNRRTGAPCNIDPVTSLPEAECRFYPNPSVTTTTSSLMYYHFLPSMSEFCDDNEFGENQHNIEAPSQHNRLCSGKSAWAVMEQSVDFANGANQGPDGDQPNKNTNVTFNVVKRNSNKRVVVVMDISGSMEKDNNYIKLATAVRRYLLYTVQTGSFVGLVEYSTAAKKITPSLVEIKSRLDRDILANKVVPQKNGHTAIGQGLLAAQSLLEAGGVDPAGSRIVLLTDGEETRGPYVAAVKPGIVAKGIVVDTILLTNAASSVLISLAADTGGLSFYSSGADDSTSLSDAYTKSERDRYTDSRLAPVTILGKVMKVERKTEECLNVSIDNTLGQDSSFIFTSDSSRQLAISVSDPNGTTSYPGFDGSSTTAYQCPGLCPTGQWEVCVKNTGNQMKMITLQVESTAAPKENGTKPGSPITVTTNIVNREPDFNQEGAKPVTVLATVSRGYSPVIGAKVIATLESPPDSGKEPVDILLRDDGALADTIKGDGTYSAYIYNANTKDKHSISVEVNGVEGQTNIKEVILNSPAASLTEPGDSIDIQEVELLPVNGLQRRSLAGFIDVLSVVPPGVDRLAPARVIDLEVIRTSYNDSSVTLSWTAVGDDVDQGNASEYQLWMSESHKVLLQNDLSNATEVNSSQVIQGSLWNLSAPYQRETITIRLQDRSRAVVFGLKVFDDASNESPMSNLVATRAVEIIPPQPQPDGVNVGLIAGISVAAACVVIIAIAVIIFLVMRKRGSMTQKNSVKYTPRSETHTNKGYMA